MSASPTIYCLQQVTDYLQFERLCHDLMVCEGYAGIEPLGGFRDKGRDAIHVDNADRVTIFAYSVREDWRVKLTEDASKISRHGHACDSLVFITTAQFTAGERDEAVSAVLREFGWKLDLYGLERLRVLLDAQHLHVKENHPSIFPPHFFCPPVQAGGPVREHVLISYSPEGRVFAGWLTQRLLAEGYKVWCEQFAVLGGDYYPDEIDQAIEEQASCVLAVCSSDSMTHPPALRQWAIARAEKHVSLIPLFLDDIDQQQARGLFDLTKVIRFTENWATGLKDVLIRLQGLSCPCVLHNGRSIASELFAESDVLLEQPETLFSNCLKVIQVPPVIHRLVPASPISREESKRFQFQWACRYVNENILLSFHEPPYALRSQYQFSYSGGASTSETKYIDGISVATLTAELIRKSLIVAARQRGLQYCSATGLHYFPFGLFAGERLYYTRPDGTKSYIGAAGQRKHWTPKESTYYRYYLAARFYVTRTLLEGFFVLVNLGVRITDTADVPLPSRTANARRKEVCGEWWNGEWFSRLLAVCQHLAEDSVIKIGQQQSEQLIVSAVPLQLDSPLSINEERVDTLRKEDLRLWTVTEDAEESESHEEADGRDYD